MVLLVNQAFGILKSNLEITDLQLSTVSDRQTAIRNVLKKELEVESDFLTGSYSRSTLIAPLSEADIDIFTVLDSQYFYNYNNQNGKQAGLLDLVKRTLKRTYTKTPDISRNGQAVTIKFTDFKVDVVPAFNRNGGGYLIPNSVTNSWIETDPTVHVNHMTNLNKLQNGLLIPCVKMIKGWNKNINTAFTSFYLEMLAAKIFSSYKIFDYSSAMKYFFEQGVNLIKYTVEDPAGYGGNIHRLNNCNNTNDAVKLFENAYYIAIKAEQQKNTPSLANQEWKKIFGSYFPSNG